MKETGTYLGFLVGWTVLFALWAMLCTWARGGNPDVQFVAAFVACALLLRPSWLARTFLGAPSTPRKEPSLLVRVLGNVTVLIIILAWVGWCLVYPPQIDEWVLRYGNWFVVAICVIAEVKEYRRIVGSSRLE